MATLPFHPSGAPVLSRHLPYRPDIDGLRAVAVLSVVAFHAFPERLPGGYVGVDIFFVISGFLISTIIYKGLSDGSFSFSQFYGRRIRCIFTALMLVLATCYGMDSSHFTSVASDDVVSRFGS